MLKYHRFIVLGLIFLAVIIVGSIFSVMNQGTYPKLPPRVTGSYLILKFGFAVLFAPLVETWICQHWLIRLVRRTISGGSEQRKWICAVVVSAVFFGLGHTYSVLYVLVTFIIGLFLGGTYWLFSIRKDLNPVLAVFLVHSLNNVSSFLLNHVRLWDGSSF